MSTPVGIFDSGVGGLTVAHAIQREAPNENILYFGDTLHMPWGDKSPQAIATYCAGITRFLLKSGSKAVVIACNTGSAYGYQAAKEVAGDIPVINVIDPVVEYVAAHYSHKRVGVIGTRATIGSNIYQRKINKINPTVIVRSMATPLLAPMVEDGLFQQPVSSAIVSHYLQQEPLQHIDAIILACTHYPLIMNQVQAFYQNQVEIIDSATIVGKHTAELMQKSGLAESSPSPHEHRFFVSDLTDSFQSTASLFFGSKIRLSHFDLW